jgi:hypothetical protein
MQVPPAYVPPEASQIAPVLVHAEAASMSAPNIDATRRAGQNFRPFASLIASHVPMPARSVRMPDVAERLGSPGIGRDGRLVAAVSQEGV